MAARRAIRLACLALVACAAVPPPVVPAVTPGAPLLYLVIVDRFENGDPRNDRDVDPSAPGAYHGGDLRGLRGRLPELRRLGVDVLLLTPIVDNIDRPVMGGGFPDWGYHGYWAQDFGRVDEHLGSEADLVALVDEAHRLGMRVLLDVVLNHPGYGSRWERDPAWTRSTSRGDCGRTPETECLHGLPDFRTEDPRVANAILSWQLDWVRRSGADGVRLDAARHVGEDVIARFVAELRAIRPGALVLSEHWGTAPGSPEAARALGHADATFDFSFADAALAFATGRAGAAAFASYLERRGDAARFVTFLGTHDTPGFLHRAGGDRDALLLGLVAMSTVPGLPLLYYGDEIGRAGGEWPANRSDMPWADDDGVLRGKVEKLGAARRGLAGPIRILARDGALLVFARGEDAIVAINAGVGPASAALGPGWRERLGWGASIEGERLVVPARSAGIFKK
jgi:alpha-amylase